MGKCYKFIDLFAGLGGFHKALEALGCKCVFASELKEDLQQLYQVNYPGTRIEGDITQIEPKDIPAHDILCAGFPCQPFSQAGKRQGFNDEKDRGNLFNYICNILAYHRPAYVFLENVSNLKGHDNGNTWNTIYSRLHDELNYEVKDMILSPHQFGIPQHRKRIYVVCKRKDLGNLDYFEFPNPIPDAECNINSIIDNDAVDVIPLKQDTRNQLHVWQEFLNKLVEHGDTLPGFPIWAMEFGATYDYEKEAPAFQSVKQLSGKRGKLGQIVKGRTLKDCLSLLPNYAQTARSKEFPVWKKRYIQQNRELYQRNQSWIDEWLKEVKDFDNSHLKMEWNCGKDIAPNLEDKIIQFRASGIRVKMPTFSPALNLVGTQIPIFPWIELPEGTYKEGEPNKGRYMTLKEASTIQGMKDIKFGNEQFKLSLTRCYEALGNAVNVELVKMIAQNLLQYGK